MSISIEDIGHDHVPPGFCGGFEGFDGVTRVRSDGHASVSQQHFRSNALIGQNLLVGESHARTRQMLLKRRGGGLVIVDFVVPARSERKKTY